MNPLLGSIPTPGPSATPVDPGFSVPWILSPDAGGDVAYLIGGIAIGYFVLRAVYPRLLPEKIPPAVGGDNRRTLIGWELDRVGSLVKGLASTAGGFLVALVVGIFKAEFVAMGAASLIGCVAGAVGMLLLAGALSTRSMKFARAEVDPPAAADTVSDDESQR